MLIPGKRLTVFAVRNTDRRGAVWVRIGSAFVNKDESLNVWLDALPLDGKLHCREAVTERQPAAMPAMSPEEAFTELPPGMAQARGGGARLEAAAGGAL